MRILRPIEQLKRIIKSFTHATEGILYVFTTQRNMKIHLGITILVLVCSFFFDVATYQLLFVLSSIALVMCMELVNTAVEKTVDLMTDEYHPLAKIAKDVAAGAVLFAAIFAFIIGLYVFLPYLLSMLEYDLPYPIESVIIVVVLCILLIFWSKKKNFDG